MPITRVEALTYGVADVPAGIRYFEDWGLELVERGAGGATFATAAGQAIHLRAIDDPALPPAPDGERSTMRRTVWGVDSDDDLQALAGELAKDREVTSEADGTLCAVDECGFAMGLARARPIAVSTEPPPTNLNGNSRRLNEAVAPPAQGRPLRLGHVVYYTPRQIGEQAASFYLDRLGFRLSDRTLTGGDFMRCAGSRDHHNLFLLQRDEGAAFNHAAFEVRDFDEIMLAGAYMKSRGWVADTTPGRHILGSNLYWYFRNPCGGNTEYFADMDCMDDDWQPRLWETSPGFALWTLDDEPAGAPPAAATGG